MTSASDNNVPAKGPLRPFGSLETLEPACPPEFYSDSRKVSHFLAGLDPLKILSQELGASFDDYRRRWDLAKTFRQIPPFPLHVDYELKRACDLRCPMCLMSEPKPAGLKAPPELSHQTVRRLIEEGAQNGQASMGFGGLWEPLTSPHIPDLVAFGREKGLVDVMFNTNGLKLDGQTSKALLEAGLTRIMISLDAVNEDTYLLMRPGSDFKTVENNVTELLALRREKKQALPLIRVSFCLTSLNEKELAAFIKRWETRVDFISVQYFGNFKSRSSISTLSPRLGLVEPPTGRCAQPFKRLSVLHDETVLPCCDLSGLKLSVGHLGKSKLMNIWKSPAIDDLRKRLMAGDERLTEDCRLCQSKYQGRQTDQIQNEA